MTTQSPYLNFAYGSNLRESLMIARCGGKAHVELMGPAVLEGYCLAFNYFATIEPCEGAAVLGLLYRVSEAGMEDLDHSEGVPMLYRRETVSALYCERPILTTVYRMVDAAPRRPARSYFGILAEAYEDLGWPMDNLWKALRASCG